MARTKTYSQGAPLRVRDTAKLLSGGPFTPWEQKEPSVVQYTTKTSKEKVHVVVAFVVKYEPEGVSKIKYGAVVTRYRTVLPASPNSFKKTALARLVKDPVTCKFSVPVPFTEKAVGAYVRNQVYRKGVSGEYTRRKRNEEQQQLVQLDEQKQLLQITVQQLADTVQQLADASQQLAVLVRDN
jgi:hypothetical protein